MKNDNVKFRIVAILVTAVFCVSLVHSFYFKINPAVDARAYDKIAMNIVEGDGYIEDDTVPVEKDFSIARVGPGYELFLAGVYKIFGHHYEIVWILHALFLALSALLAFLISKQVLGDSWNFTIGVSALALVGFSPDLIIISSMLMTETLGIFLMLLCVYSFLKYYEGRNWISFLVFTACFVLATFVRSQMATFLVVFLVMFILKKDWKKMVLFLALVILLFSPWVIRNYLVYDAFIPFNAALGHNLWTSSYVGATGEMEPYAPQGEYLAKYGALATHKEGIEVFKKFVWEHPVEFAKITLKRISIFFSFSRPTGFWPTFSAKQQAGTAFFSLIYSVFVFILGISGAVLFWKRKNISKEKFLYFLAFAVLIPASIMFILVETRYRFALYPFLAVFGGLAVSEIVSKRNIKFLIWPAVILFANSVLDFVLNFGKFYDKIKNIL